MKKRTESNLVTAILMYCQVLENAGRIMWVDRLNSGDTTVVKKYRLKSGATKQYTHKIRGCRPGTPDIYIILIDGKMLWVEAKTNKGKLSKAQEDWKFMISQCSSHIHVTVRDLDGLLEYLKFVGVEI